MKGDLETMERVKSLLKYAEIDVQDIYENQGVVYAETDVIYLHFDKIKKLSESMMFKGIRSTPDEVLVIEFITL